MTSSGERRYRRGAEKRSRPIQAFLVLLCVVSSWLVAGSPVGHLLDNNLADLLVRWLREHPESKSVSTLVAIDEETLNGYGGIRAMRPIVAGILEALRDSRPKVVAIDLTLADNGDPAEDARLANAIAELPAVVLAAEIRSTGNDWEMPATRFANASSSIGHVHAAPDPMDSVCRALPLEKAVDRQRYWALSLEAYRIWRGEPYVLETTDSLVVGSVEIPASRQEGRLMRIRFLPPRRDGVSGVSRISAAELLRAGSGLKLPPSERVPLEVVFVGVTAPSAARDRLMTPYSYGRTMQGVEIHANAFETLASRRFYLQMHALPGFALSILLALCVAVPSMFLSSWRTYAFAGVPLLLSVLAPAVGYRFDFLVPSTLLLLSAWLPFVALAIHRYRFVNRKMHRAEQETENYRDAIHYVTHEMRTPLTAIQGSSEIISRYALSEDKQKQIAGMIHSESKRLGRLIQVFLDVERLSAGQMQLRDEAIRVAELISLSMDRARPLAENKEISLVVHHPCSPEALMYGDPELLEHALYNLVTNAIKYSPGGSRVQLRCEQRENSRGRETAISVLDEGIGMSAEEQKAVFRKFYRTAAAEKSGEKGSGIGLSIVEQIVHAHGGRMELRSEPGTGSEFTMVLPARVSTRVEQGT